jgi:hypothetical protein
MEEKACAVCCEEFEKLKGGKAKRVVCPFCSFTSCSSCAKRYLTESDADPHCMNCRKSWNRRILSERFSKLFMSQEYKQYRERILFERERALLPATQVIAEETIRRRELAKEKSGIEGVLVVVYKDFCAASRSLAMDYSDEKAREQNVLAAQCSGLRKELKRIDYKLNGGVDEKKKGSVATSLIHPCSAEKCKGFMGEDYLCGLCGTQTCSKCLFTKSAKHECKEEDVETATAIRKETRPCPECHIPIFRISGCDQMFCTQCKTVFSWKTGQKETGNVHNPHYFEWRRSQGLLERAPGDFQCGRIIDHFFVLQFKWFRFGHDKVRQIIHLREIELERFRVNILVENENLRLRYLLNEITEEQFRVRLQRAEKASQMKKEVFDVLSMFITCVTDTLYRVTSDFVSDEICKAVEALRQYVNEQLRLISASFNCSTNFKINSSFVLVRE